MNCLGYYLALNLYRILFLSPQLGTVKIMAVRRNCTRRKYGSVIRSPYPYRPGSTALAPVTVLRFSFLLMLNLLICLVTVLDPRISYQGLLPDCEDNIPLKKYLDLSREDLHAFYRKHYTNTAPSRTSSASAPQPSVVNSSPQKFNFTARYNKIRTVVDELEEYFKLAQGSFEHCDPIRWWAGRRAVSKLVLFGSRHSFNTR